MSLKVAAAVLLASQWATVAFESPVFAADTGLVSRNELLIREVTSLRSTLLIKDPVRTRLTSRLADLHFDQSIVFGRDSNEGAKRQAQLQAVAFYEEVLSGNGGILATPTGAALAKVQFQLGRLHADLGGAKSIAQSLVLLEKVFAQNDVTELKREAALRLAESLEANASSQQAVRAEKYYQVALDLCEGGDACSYTRFKRAWLFFNQRQLERAISEMELALFDSKGQLREESLRDYVSFLGGRSGDGRDALVKMDELARKISRPTLLVDLAEAFYSSGNKLAGTEVLAFANSRTPRPDFQIRLVEEFYGLRQWDRFRSALNDLKALSPEQIAGLDESPRVESEKVFRRLVIQLDGERISQKEYVSDFKIAALTYLSIFPRSPERTKMIDGWLAAETDPSSKISQLKSWIAEASAGSDQVRLREFRASIAQKSGALDIVIEEMSALSATASAKSREYRYLWARAHYEKKDFVSALSNFKTLAELGSSAPDQWAIQSQNLALDILGQQKNFAALTTQAQGWLNHSGIAAFAAKNTELARELSDMKKIAIEASFEGASAMAQNASQAGEALSLFAAFCEQGVLTEKSCENARVLAIKQGNTPAVLAALKAQGKTEELAAEYEAAAFFGLSAELQEKLSSGKTMEPTLQLKIALLYELEGRNADRDRVIKKLLGSQRQGFRPTELESLALQTIEDASLVDASLLKFNWSTQGKSRIAHGLESSGQGSADTRKILLASLESVGPAWDRLVVREIQNLDSEQSKISFHGKQSRARFESRLKGIKKLVETADRYLPGAGAITRVQIAATLITSHTALAAEILGSPIPEGLPEEAVAQVKASLQQMADPFQAKAKEFDQLARDQVTKIADFDARAQAEKFLTPETYAAIESKELSVSDTITMAAAATAPAVVISSIEALRRNAGDMSALTALKNFYSSSKQDRLAAYFTGRISQLQKQLSGGQL